MKTMSSVEAQADLDSLWEAAAQDTVTIEDSGEVVAIVVSPEEYLRLQQNER